MKCVQFEKRLNEMLDERHSPVGDLALHQHASECQACARMLDSSFILEDLRDDIDSSADFDAASAYDEMLDDSFSLRVVRQALQQRDSDPDLGSRAPRMAIEAEVVEGATRATTQDPYRELERKLQLRRRRWTSPAALAIVAALVVVACVPLVSLIGSSFAPPAQVAHSPASVGATGERAEPVNSNSQNNLALSHRERFLGPAPFSTGGNIAVTLSVIPIPIEEMGIENYIEPNSIDAVRPIANSLSLLVDRIWKSIPSIRLGPISLEPSMTSLDPIETLHLA